MITQEECDVLKRKYHQLLTQGYHPKAARRIVCTAAVRVLQKKGVEVSGMGQEDPENILMRAADISAIKTAREAVSPWLWVLSLVGFGMTLLNTKRIARMFKGWKAKAGKKAS